MFFCDTEEDKEGRKFIYFRAERVEINAHWVFYAARVIESFPSMEPKDFFCTAEGKMGYDAGSVPDDKWERIGYVPKILNEL